MKIINNSETKRESTFDFIYQKKRFYHFCSILLSIFTSLLIAQDHNVNYNDGWKFLGLENENITAIAVDWSNPDIIYAGSDSDFSAGTLGGIFKSINAGADWDTLIRGVTVRDIDIHPKNPEIIYAALGLNVLTQPGIIKTTDAGNTWVKADSGITINWEEGPAVLEINPEYPDTLYCGTGGFYGGEPYKSTNGGESWFKIAPYIPRIPTLCGDSVYNSLLGGVTAIAIDPENTNTIYFGTASLGHVYKTTNGGTDWFATCMPQVGIVKDLAIVPFNTQHIYCGTIRKGGHPNGIFKSSDGGITFYVPNSGLPDTFSVLKIEIYNNSQYPEFYLTGFNNDTSGIYRCIDGEYWENFGNIGITATTLKIINKTLYAGSGAGIFKTDIPVSVLENNIAILVNFHLYHNFPNPFNPGTNIIYEIPVSTNVLLGIFDTQGKKVKTLVDKEQLPGKYSVY